MSESEASLSNIDTQKSSFLSSILVAPNQGGMARLSWHGQLDHRVSGVFTRWRYRPSYLLRWLHYTEEVISLTKLQALTGCYIGLSKLNIIIWIILYQSEAYVCTRTNWCLWRIRTNTRDLQLYVIVLCHTEMHIYVKKMWGISEQQGNDAPSLLGTDRRM